MLTDQLEPLNITFTNRKETLDRLALNTLEEVTNLRNALVQKNARSILKRL